MATLTPGTLAVPAGIDALATVLRHLSDEATLSAAFSFARSVSLLAGTFERPHFRTRRGRGVSRSAKRRHARAVRATIARAAMHAEAGRLWGLVAGTSSVIADPVSEAA